jgi:hypothetical protein
MPNTTQFPPSQGGWKKYDGNPVLGDTKTGTCFDVLVYPEYDGRLVPATGDAKSTGYRMYFSWRPKKSLAVVKSADGIRWGEPRIILGPDPASGWEDDLNRNCVVEKDGVLHMWYTGQAHGNSWIGYAVGHAAGSAIDGSGAAKNGDSGFIRVGREPVLFPEQPWENMSVMNPCVLWDQDRGVFRMWYSAGETYEPNVICYAESGDGVNWRKHRANPIFTADKRNVYEQERIGGCQVLPYRGGYLMFYIGYEDIDTARICGAWSPDGLSRWKRFDCNPIVSPEPGKWDGDACYKPGVVFDKANRRWLLWYNGRLKNAEYIGLVIHDGEDLGINP